jgi:hypothetical protein
MVPLLIFLMQPKKLSICGFLRSNSHAYFSPVLCEFLATHALNSEGNTEEPDSKVEKINAFHGCVVEGVVRALSPYVWTMTRVNNSWNDIDPNLDQLLARITNVCTSISEFS